MKPTEDDRSPVQDRYTLMFNALDKQVGNDHGTNVGINLDEFVMKLRSLRMATIKYGSNLAESFLIDNLNATYPGLEIAGRRIQSSADLVEFYKRGPNDPKMRAIIQFCTDTVWGDNNQWAINGEANFCRRFLIKYTGAKSNGKRTTKVHKGRCIAQIFVATKGTLIEKIRNAGKKFHFEAIYRRGEKSKIGLPGTDSKGIPRMILQIPATVESHGFNGKLGICDGHPEAKKIKEKAQPSVVETPNSQDSQISSITMSTSAPGSEQSELMTWMASMNLNLLHTTKEDMLSALLVDNTETLLQNPDLLRTPDRQGANTVVTASTVGPPSPANNDVVTDTSPDLDETPEQVSASSLYLRVSGFGIFLMIFSPPCRLILGRNHPRDHLRNHLRQHLQNHLQQHLQNHLRNSRWNCNPDFAPKYLEKNPHFPSK